MCVCVCVACERAVCGSTQKCTSPAETTARSDVSRAAATAAVSTSSRDVRAARNLKLFNGHLNTRRVPSAACQARVSLLTPKAVIDGSEPPAPGANPVDLFARLFGFGKSRGQTSRASSRHATPREDYRAVYWDDAAQSFQRIDARRWYWRW